MLVILGGLPAAGKSTIAMALSQKRSAVYVRVDDIETQLKRNGVAEVGTMGYAVAQGICRSNLRLGHEVIADSVNPVAESRASWCECAVGADSRYLEIEIVCSDEDVHRTRSESRPVEIEGLEHPKWAEIKQRRYEEWTSPDLRIDTAVTSIAQAVEKIGALIEDASR